MSFNGNLYESDEGLELTTKAQIHTHDSSSNIALDVSGNNGYLLSENSGTSTGLEWIDGSHANPTQSLIIACSDETTAIADTGTVLTFYMPYAFTLTQVLASLVTTSSSGTPTIDINEAGSTILSTKITVDAGDLISTDSAVQPVLSDTALALYSKITIDIDVTGTDATGLKVYFIGNKT